MRSDPPMLHMLCGKIASGKSTLAARLGAAPGTVLISEDAWLNTLFRGELQTLEDYVGCSTKLRNAMEPHLIALLASGISVVLDFAANTVGQRRWMKRIVEKSETAHQLHVLSGPDEVCLARLRGRTAEGNHPFAVSEAQFHEFTSHFTAPLADEGFNVVMHGDGSDGVSAR